MIRNPLGPPTGWKICVKVPPFAWRLGGAPSYRRNILPSSWASYSNFEMKNKRGNVQINVTLRRIRLTIVAVEKQ